MEVDKMVNLKQSRIEIEDFDQEPQQPQLHHNPRRSTRNPNVQFDRKNNRNMGLFQEKLSLRDDVGLSGLTQ